MLCPHWMQGAAAQGERCQPGHTGIGTRPHHRLQQESHRMGQCCGHRALNVGALAALEALWGRDSPIPASLLGASPAAPQSHGTAGTEQGSPATTGRGAEGTGLGTMWGDSAGARVSLPLSGSVCCVRLRVRGSGGQGSDTTAGSGHLCNNTFAECAQRLL